MNIIFQNINAVIDMIDILFIDITLNMILNLGELIIHHDKSWICKICIEIYHLPPVMDLVLVYAGHKHGDTGPS